MRIACLGGGPAGLYFAILFKQAYPGSEIDVYERNRSDDTFGWGVVFSDETLGHFQRADPESFAAIQASFVTWTDIQTFVRGQVVRSTGHGFCGLSRKRMLEILHARAGALGVRLHFQREIRDDAELGDADLILGCDGINSIVRQKHAAVFRPSVDWRGARFCWLGTTLPLEAFTFVFQENEHGLFQVHAYPFEPGLSTWIVETHEDTWKRAGLDQASEERTIAYCEELFAPHLAGHRLLANRSLWRSFPTVRCERWTSGKLVLVGDAAHTAHFSIGSGTKLALEDAIALVDVFQRLGTGDVPAALAQYERERKSEVIRLQKAAQTSLEWFENSRRYLTQPPLQFQFNLMTRSKRITYGNLKLRDPRLVAQVDAWFADHGGGQRAPDGAPLPPGFAPFRLRSLELANRIVVSPMCQYSAVDGTVGEWHLVHLGSRALGGASLVMGEMTDVSREGRITHACAGMYAEQHVAAWKRIVDFVHARTPAKIGLQLAHAGRKGSCSLPWEGDRPLVGADAWETLGPSAVPFAPDWPAPREMTRADMERVQGEFVRAARMAERAGFDLLELHLAHGYLLSSFLSPKSNIRRDAYGGALENRLRFPLEVFAAVRAAWPSAKPLAARISASDWLDDAGGQTIAESVEIARALKDHGCDLVDVSSAGNTPESRPEYGRMYQVPFAERIRAEAGVPVMAVGGIQSVDHVHTIVAAGRADLCALARAHLFDPYLTLHAAAEAGVYEQPWPLQYLAVKPRPRALES